MEDMNKMKKITRNLVESTNIGDSSSVQDTEKCVANVRLENDQGYFNTYAHFGIHHEMLSVFILFYYYYYYLLSVYNIIFHRIVFVLRVTEMQYWVTVHSFRASKY